MAGVTRLRDAARNALLNAGGRGFVRFLSEGDALLVSDAPRRCGSEEEIARLVRGLEAEGFFCRVRDGLMHITPGDALLLALCDAQPERIQVDWSHPLWEAMALCGRLLRERPLALDADGRRMLIETARILWQPKDKALAGLTALRARAAALLRSGKRSGLYETGRLLCGWLEENRTKEKEEALCCLNGLDTRALS